jgi:hypothetical protein
MPQAGWLFKDSVDTSPIFGGIGAFFGTLFALIPYFTMIVV